MGLDDATDDAAQCSFSTLSPSGFPEHRKRCLSPCLRVYDTPTEYVQVQIFCI